MLLEILTSPLLGGLTGAIASYFQKKQELEVLVEKNKHQAKMSELTSSNKIKETQAQSVSDDRRISAESFLESQKTVPSKGDTIKSAVRVITTIYLLIAMSWLGWTSIDALGGVQELPEDVLSDIVIKTVYAIIYLTVTCLTWWYGQRPSQTFRMIGVTK